MESFVEECNGIIYKYVTDIIESKQNEKVHQHKKIDFLNRFVLPANFRKELGIQEGDNLEVWIHPNERLTYRKCDYPTGITVDNMGRTRTPRMLCEWLGNTVDIEFDGKYIIVRKASIERNIVKEFKWRCSEFVDNFKISLKAKRSFKIGFSCEVDKTGRVLLPFIYRAKLGLQDGGNVEMYIDGKNKQLRLGKSKHDNGFAVDYKGYFSIPKEHRQQMGNNVNIRLDGNFIVIRNLKKRKRKSL